MELRNICNHPYLSQLHVEEVECKSSILPHYCYFLILMFAINQLGSLVD